MVKKLTSAPTLPLSENDKREVCDLHGWVGRKIYQRERHDLCEVPVDKFSDDETDSTEADRTFSPDDVEPADADDADDADVEAADAPDEIDDQDSDDDEGADDADGAEGATDPPRWSRASARRQGIPPKKTLAVRRITQLELAAGRAELQALGADGPYWRPKTRGDCANVPRPCPYVACKYSLFLDVSDTGSIILNFPHLEPGEMPANQSCALDLAEQRAMTLEEIAVVTNLTRERIRQVELKALIRRARPAAIEMGLGPDDAAAVGARHRVGPGADLEETGVEGAVPSDVATILASGSGDDS
ncbi:MAG TPA: sigma factor-like helix-turn-helix DNA-binding protein [Gaiellaceae bacterium]|nr:sigma factor-like helix-turn-helix DNA-binding protein [Gaiellaceae bacterium]